jgi:hypothetical protein
LTHTLQFARGPEVHYFEYLRKMTSEINIIVALIMVHCDEKWPEGKLSCVQLLSSRTGLYFQALYTYGTSQVMDVGRRHCTAATYLLKPVLNPTFQILTLILNSFEMTKPF